MSVYGGGNVIHHYVQVFDIKLRYFLTKTLTIASVDHRESHNIIIIITIITITITLGYFCRSIISKTKTPSDMQNSV